MSSVPSHSWMEDLIDLVLKQPVLFDSSHQDYRNLAKRERAWEALAERLDTTSEDVKKRWKSLRDTFSRIIKRRRKSSGLGKFKKWIWADKMEPLRVHLTACNGSDNTDPSPDADGEYYSENTTDSAIQEQKATSSHNINTDFARDPMVPEVMLATTSSPMTGSKRKFHEVLPAGSVDWGYSEDGRGSRMDALDLLMLAHAGTIRTFSGKRQAITKLKIAQIIMEQELLHQEEISEN